MPLSTANSEEDISAVCRQRAMRLNRLLVLNAPDYILARELALVTNAINTLFEKHGYDPETDPRSSLEWKP